MSKKPASVYDVYCLIESVTKQKTEEICQYLDAIETSESDQAIKRSMDDAFDGIEALLKAHPLSDRSIAKMLFWFGSLKLQLEDATERLNKLCELQQDHHERETALNKLKKKLNAHTAAKAKHAKSGAGTVKKEVQRYWFAWQTQHPDRHKSASAFALVMLDKYPDQLRNQQTVTRWCREWETALRAHWNEALSAKNAPQS